MKMRVKPGLKLGPNNTLNSPSTSCLTAYATGSSRLYSGSAWLIFILMWCKWKANNSLGHCMHSTIFCERQADENSYIFLCGEHIAVFMLIISSRHLLCLCLFKTTCLAKYQQRLSLNYSGKIIYTLEEMIISIKLASNQ